MPAQSHHDPVDLFRGVQWLYTNSGVTVQTNLQSSVVSRNFFPTALEG